MPEPLKSARYELLARLTIDVTGELLLACDRAAVGVRRLVVLERVPPRAIASAEFVEAFLRQADALSRLRHPNLIRIQGLDRDEETFYLTTDYRPGCTLQELQLFARQRGVAFPVGVAVAALIQGLRGLHAAHELRDEARRPIGLVHGAFAAQQLMLNERGEVKLFGFGLGKAAPKGPGASDRRADIHAVGATLWELLTGSPPPLRSEEGVPRLRDHIGGVGAKLQAVIDRSLADDPSARYATARAMAEALRHFAIDLALDIGTGTVGGFVEEIAGDRLRARKAAAADALRGPLSDDQRRALVFGTGAEPAAALTTDQLSLAPADGAPPASLAAHILRRRRWLVGAAILALLLAAGIQMQRRGYFETDAPPTGVPLRVAWAPLAPTKQLREEVEPLRRYLERKLDRPIELLIPGDYRAASDHLIAGAVDVAVLPPYTFAATRRANAGVEGLATPKVDGATQVDGLLLVREDSPSRLLEDLRGASFCLSDPDATTGNMLARTYIRHHGHDPDTFLGDVRWSGDDLSVLADLLEGRCDAGAISSASLLSAQLMELPVSRLRRLAITGSAPQPVWAAGPGLDPTTKAQLRQALLGLDVLTAFGAPRIGRAQRISGYAALDEAAYAQLPIDAESARPAAAVAAEGGK